MFSRMWNALKSHFNKTEIVSLAQTFVGFLAVDAIVQFQRVLSGDISEDALVALVVAVARSFVKAIWSMSVAAFKKIQPSPHD